jgi:hypothetical protein
VPEAANRQRDGAIALAILAAAMAVAAGLLLHWGRGQVMAGDDLFYAQRLAESSLGHAILHSNLYLLALPMALYEGMFELFGIGSYLPYRLLAVALGLLCAGLFYAIARRRIGPWLALAPTVLLLFYGSGGEELLTGTRIPSLVAIASGLGAVLALERQDRPGDVLAALLLCVSATSHPTGIGFLVAAAIIVAWRPSPRRWASSWVVLVPAALVAAFLAFYQRTADTPDQGLVDVLSFERASWTMLTAAVSGLSGVLRSPVWDRPLAVIASALLLALIVAGAALRWRRLRPTFWAAAGGLVVLLAATRLSPGGFIRVPDAPRYLYPETILFLWLLVELGAAWRDAGSAGARAGVAGAVTAVLLLGTWSNVAKLEDAGHALRATSTVARGQYSAYDLERDRLRPSYTPSAFFPTAGNYLAAADAYGSIGLSPPELAGASPAIRAATDRALVGALGLGLRPATGSAPDGSRRPRIVKALAGTAAGRRGCVELRPPRGNAASPPVPGAPAPARPLAMLELPAGGAWIGGGDLTPGDLVLGRFADPPVVALGSVPAGHGRATVLRLPPDRVGQPWTLLVASREPVAVCGLRA